MSDGSLPLLRAPDAASAVSGRGSALRLAIVAIYALSFFGALPWALWQLGGSFDRWFSLGALPSAASLALGALLGLFGVQLMARAVKLLWLEGHGLPISHLPPERLVQGGAFARLRHPIYVGYSLTFMGLGLASGSIGRGCFSFGLLTLAWFSYAAGLEEPTLRRRFGSSYERYAAATTRLLPRSEGARRAALRAWVSVRPALERLATWTVLFRFRHGIWVTFGLFVALGTGAAATVGSALFASRLPPARLDEYLLLLIAALLTGGRFAWLAYNAEQLRREPWATLRSVGFVSFGSYLALFLVVALWPRFRAPGVDAFWLFDRTLVACFVASALGRIGCHTYGCCYGKPVDHGLCVREPLSKVVRERGPLGREPRFPLQIASGAWALAVAALGFSILAASAPNGVSSATSVLVYALGRFGLESFRDEPRLAGGRYTRGQLLCMVLAGGALTLLLVTPFRSTSGSEPLLALAAPFTHAPAILLASVLAFVVCGYHREKVGRW